MKSLARAKNQTISGYNAAPCSYFDGLYDYFNLNADAYHAAWAGQKWNGPCVHIYLHRQLLTTMSISRAPLRSTDTFSLELTRTIKLSFTTETGTMLCPTTTPSRTSSRFWVFMTPVFSNFVIMQHTLVYWKSTFRLPSTV